MHGDRGMSATAETGEAVFDPLIGLAYRMLGSRAEAEDVVQDAYLRWHAADRAVIADPRRYLGTVVTRLCLDRVKSAQSRRELLSDGGCRSQSSMSASTRLASTSWRRIFPSR
jgi:DNA-directed RNA polymerase specialized sigma24 family protein